MNAVDLWMVRHGHSEHHHQDRLQWPDAALSEEGSSQAERLAARLASLENVSALYSSPLRRAWDTAQPIAAALNLDPIRLLGLREIDFGQAGGLSREAFSQRWPDLMSAWEDLRNLSFQWPGGESRRDFQRRAVETMESLVEAHRGQRIVVVAHTGTLRCYLAHLFLEAAWRWREFPLRPASLSRVRVGPDSAQIIFQDSVSHLEPPEEPP